MGQMIHKQNTTELTTMKKLLRNIFCVALGTPLLVHCAMQSDVNDLRYQLRIVNKKLEDMKANTVGQLQKNQAATVGQMDSLENEILALKSQLEDSDHLNQRLREQNKELEETINGVAQDEASKREAMAQKLEAIQQEKEAQLAELNERLAQQQKSVKAMQEARLIEAERKAKEAALTAELAKSKALSSSKTVSSQHLGVDKKKVKLAAPEPSSNNKTAVTPEKVTASPVDTKPAQIAAKQTPPPPPPVANKPSEDEVLLDNARKLYANKDYKGALPLFTQVADSKDSSADTVEARYLMGECLLELKEYDKAIMQFQRIISQNPNHSRAAAAMLQQGITFEKLSDKDTAKVIYKKLLKQHPSSPEATTAQANLDKL
jgi:tol-pal system protein YbgF